MEDNYTAEPNVAIEPKSQKNKPWLFAYGVVFIVWILTLVFVFCTGSYDFTTEEQKDHLIKFEIFLNDSRIPVLIGYIFLAFVYCGLVFVLLRWCKSYTCTSYFWFWITLTVYIMFNPMSHVHLGYKIYVCSRGILILTFLCYLASREGLYLPTEFLQETCRAFLRFPVIILCFVFACFVLLTLPLVVTILSILYSNNILCRLISAMCGIWTCAIITLYEQMVLHKVFSTWFWAQNKDELKVSNLMLHSITLIGRYQMGTIFYASSLFGILRVVLMLIAYTIRKIKEGSVAVSIFLFLHHLYTLELSIVLIIMLSSVFRSAVTGKEFSEAAKSSIEIFDKYPRKCLLVLHIEVCIIMLTLFLAILIHALATSFLFMPYAKNAFTEIFTAIYGINEPTHVVPPEDLKLTGIFVAITFLLTIYIFTNLLAIIHAGYYAIFFCFLEDLQNHELNKKPYAMNSRLQSMLDSPSSLTCCQAFMCCASPN